MNLKFTSPHDQEPGMIASMLRKSYADLLESDQVHWGPEAPKWEQFDGEVFEHPDTVGSCVFLSWAGNQLVGFGSHDPRQEPECGIVGHNCILPEFRSRGFGKQQIFEILRRFQARGIRTAKTRTLAGTWHIPAQRMYTACGFQETGRHPWDGDQSQTVIEYEKRLDSNGVVSVRGDPACSLLLVGKAGRPVLGAGWSSRSKGRSLRAAPAASAAAGGCQWLHFSFSCLFVCLAAVPFPALAIRRFTLSRVFTLLLPWLLATVAVSVTGCGGGGKAGPTCAFRGKWPAGRQCVYQVDVREETTTKAPGHGAGQKLHAPDASRSSRSPSPVRGMPVKGGGVATSVVDVVWQTIEANLSVRDEPAAGTRIADLVIVSAEVEREQRTGTGPARIVRRKLERLAGARVECGMDSGGAVVKVNGVRNFMRQVIGDSPLANETFAGVVNEDFLEQMRITGWKHLPDGPADPGSVWIATDKIEFPCIGKILVRQRHRFEKWEERGDRVLARVSWWGSVGNVVEKTAADEVLPEKVKKVESVGWCLFSPSLGMVVAWSENLTVVTVLEAGVGDEVTQEMHRRIEVKLAGPVMDSKRSSGRLLGDKKVSVVRRPRETENKNEKDGIRFTGQVPKKTGGGG